MACAELRLAEQFPHGVDSFAADRKRQLLTEHTFRDQKKKNVFCFALAPPPPVTQHKPLNVLGPGVPDRSFFPGDHAFEVLALQRKTDTSKFCAVLFLPGIRRNFAAVGLVHGK
ncbi:hypothetical protein RUM44_000286 [Polyplax serrata]|uniref:Uncharacterized protein n=1 Tax=Polyplax serrata TaxID=468196 RepID=A0ABR1B5H6_POLSC